MRFYIIGNMSLGKDISMPVKKAAFSSSDLDTTIDTFVNFVNEVRFTNMYLVADFEVSKQPMLDTFNRDSDSLPFFVIGEWHIGDDKSEVIRNDITVVQKKGFEHEFSNNLTAMREFLYCINNHIECVFKIRYGKHDSYYHIDKVIERHICSSVQVVRAHKKIPLRKVKISGIDKWQMTPMMKRDIVDFNKFVIPEPSGLHDVVRTVKLS